MDGNRHVIFSLYIDIPDEKLEVDLGPFPGDLVERALVVKQQYQKYYSRLVENHEAYATAINADYIVYGNNSPEWIEFHAEWHAKFPMIATYHIVNFFKFCMMEDLSKIYDKVLYVDLDVAFNTDKDFFDTMEDGLNLFVKNLKEDMPSIISNHSYNLHRRGPPAKWFLVRAMCMEDFIPYTDEILNSGVVGVNRKTMKQLAYMDNLEDCLNLITRLKEDTNSMFIERIQASFDWNNEAIATYLTFKNNVPLVNNAGPWNYHVRRVEQEEFDKAEKYIIHFIMKHFNWYFGEADGD